MDKNLIMIIGWPVSLAGAFLVGKVTTDSSSNKGKESPQAVVKTVSPKSSRSSEYSTHAQSKDQLRSGIIAVANVTEEEFEDNYGIQKVMQVEDPIARASLLLGIIENMGTGDFENVVDDFRKLGITRSRVSEYTQLLHAWARVDPLGALEYSQQNRRSDFAEGVILSSWATSSPSAAIEWAETNFDGDDANPYMVGIIRGLASSDPALATSLLNDMPYSEERGDALRGIINTLSSNDSESAIEWLDTIEDDRLKSGATTRLVSRLANTDPEGIAEWVTSIDDENTRNRSIREVADIWVEKDVEQAKVWVDSLSSADRTSAARGMIGEYVDKDVAAASEWLDTMKNEDGYQQVLESFIGSANDSVEQREVGLAQIANIADQEDRENYYSRSLSRWARSDADAVKTWLENNTVPESVSTQVLSRISERANN